MTLKNSMIAAALMLLGACAKEGYPSGGPKDEKPPEVLEAMPKNGTLNFDAKEFVVNFDEYVTVRDADNNILVSPPMQQKPEYGTKGRGIVVKIKDTLLPNTTYLFQFKEGIADFNEGNVLPSYEYVFSTGNSIDSMSIRGQVVDAFTQKASTEQVTVVAYAAEQVAQFDSMQRAADTLGLKASNADSIVSKQQPMYMTRCDKEGAFELNYLREGSYLLLALCDGDKNLRLNANEAAAFADTLVASMHMPAAKDTTQSDSTRATDSTRMASDSIAEAVDTMLASEEKYPPIPLVKLNLSQNKVERQRTVKSEFKSKGNIEIATMCPLSSRYTLRNMDTTDKTPLYIAANRKNDTLTIWTANRNCDSIAVVLSDSDFVDTLRMRYRTKAAVKSMRGGIKDVKPSSMRSLVATSHPYYDTLRIAFQYPVETLVVADTEPLPVSVLSLTDSITTRCALTLAGNCEPQGSTLAYIDFQGKAGQKYQITIPEGCVRDIYGKINADALTITTEYTKVESYGNITVQMQLGDTSTKYIVQLINEKGDAIRQEIVSQSGKVYFLHLKGGKYSFRAIADLNNDGQWTAGDYYSHRQPEPVYYFEKILELRENWDMDEKWEIK